MLYFIEKSRDATTKKSKVADRHPLAAVLCIQYVRYRR